MIDELADLLKKKAALFAAHDGVPAASRHLHAACHELTLLLRQALERLLGGHAAAPEPVPVQAPPPAPEPAAAQEPVPVPPSPPAPEPAPDPQGAPLRDEGGEVARE